MLTEVADEKGLGSTGGPFSVFDVVILVDVQTVDVGSLVGLDGVVVSSRIINVVWCIWSDKPLRTYQHPLRHCRSS